MKKLTSARGGPANCVDAGFLTFLRVEIARGDHEPGGGAGLVGAERGAPGEGQVKERPNRLPVVPDPRTYARRRSSGSHFGSDLKRGVMLLEPGRLCRGRARR